ncbi:Glutathionylspermidine synthase [Palleronia marisminoris]|uniref:Putative acid--amine ligase YgiC n=1 Tax=Palleronia marisminoris TaxID=315423 RepID=A0A1Y5SAK5_9RHOB|nr:glutathionylspermidine synthase family protein [Palleronia marisminoris]SFG70662.1 Glutathionylspermidine synthase [Palleronia marisminoris]SLN35997.1 Putative acid--amine ligase YgiC [Palleronia marisminoris]
MRRDDLGARPDWKEKADEAGFGYTFVDGALYWDEAKAYAFTLEEIEEGLERPAEELHQMCRDAVAEVVDSEELLERLQIPEAHRDLVADSWRAGEPELYGRMDFSWGGEGPAKLLEYNADTPTTLYETSGFQWHWLEDMIAAGRLPEGADQFNGIHEALVARFAEICDPNTEIHFAAFADAVEDYATVEAIAWAAREAGMGAHFTDIRKIGVTDTGQFADAEDQAIGTLFKLYPWEDMLRDDFADAIAGANVRIIEPAWKAILSNKGILPVLWRMFPGHPNLLPAVFADEDAETVGPDVVEKPIFSREGAGVRIRAGADSEASSDTAYDAHPRILQSYAPLPRFGDDYVMCGIWMIGAEAHGLGLREDVSRITQDTSRFRPHYIEP